MKKIVYKGKVGSPVEGVTFTVCHYKSKVSKKHLVIETLTKSTNSMWRNNLLLVSWCGVHEEPEDVAWYNGGFDFNQFEQVKG